MGKKQADRRPDPLRSRSRAPRVSGRSATRYEADAAKASKRIAAPTSSSTVRAVRPRSDSKAGRAWNKGFGGPLSNCAAGGERIGACAFGLAIALQQQGGKDAAMQLLALNSFEPGHDDRHLGVRGTRAAAWSARCRSVSRPPRWSGSSPPFRRPSIDMRVSLRWLLRLRVVPENPNPQPYEPVRMRIELTNNSIMPLAIDRDGPLRPQVLIVPKFSTAVPMGGEVKPFVVNLDRRLRLMPRETVAVTIDLHWYVTGAVLNAIAPLGGIVKLTVQNNFMATDAAVVVPSLYGLEVEAPLLRIDGVRKNDQWLSKAIATISDSSADSDAVMIQIAMVTAELMLAEDGAT